MRKLRLLLGGSPCTHWSIAQKNNRETEPSGIGWELFKNYLIAKEKFKPHYFLYENNVSASKAIKEQIKKELGVWDGSLLMPDTGARYIEINSALVSAQNRKRFYVHNIPEVGQPEDRGILLKDILESGVDLSQKEKSYCLTATYNGAVAWNTLERGQRTMVAVPIQGGGMGAKTGLYACPVNDIDGKARTIKGQYGKTSIANLGYTASYGATMVVEPIRIGTEKLKYLNDKNLEHLMRPFGSKGKILAENADKTPTIMAAMGTGGGNGIYVAENLDEKTNVITTVTKDNLVAVPIQGGGMGATTGLYAVPITYPIRKNSDVCITDKSIRCVQRDKKKSSVAESFCYFDDVKCGALTTAHIPMTIQAINFVDGKTYPVYQVQNGLITIKDKQYPIKLPNGYYIIRKLTVLECKRLQTVRDDYIFPVSNSQAYKMLGNGWTVDVIVHILSHIPNLQDYELEVLSLYDGMSCGNLALEKLGCKIARYVSYEIDKWAIKTTQANFPFVEQRGDAFQIREHDWKY